MIYKRFRLWAFKYWGVGMNPRDTPAPVKVLSERNSRIEAWIRVTSRRRTGQKSPEYFAHYKRLRKYNRNRGYTLSPVSYEFRAYVMGRWG